MKTWPAILVLLVAAVAGWFAFGGGAGGSASAAAARAERLTIERGDVVRTAVAVGRVEPERESEVKSVTGGVLTKLFVKLGQRIAAGDALAEVRPVATDRTYLAAERALLSAKEGKAAATEFAEGEHLASWLLRFVQGKDNLERMRRGAERAERSAEESLELLRTGTVEIDGRQIDYVIRAPVAGTVIALPVREGAPITPASNFGSGTVLMTIADLDQPVFRGTVDEIDVGRLRLGMPATLTVGALPEVELRGKIVEIGLKGVPRDQAVTFPLRVELEAPSDVVLRAGYSAVATLVLERREDVVTVPERFVEIRTDGTARAWRLDAGADEPRAVDVELGLSDGSTAEVVTGLTAGDTVVSPDWSAMR